MTMLMENGIPQAEDAHGGGDSVNEDDHDAGKTTHRTEGKRIQEQNLLCWKVLIRMKRN